MNDVAERPRAGLVLGSRFRLDKRIGEGGFGDVWRATDLTLDTAVAVKTLSPRLHLSDGQAHVARLLNEATLARRVDCPHVVSVLECARSLELGPYLVMGLARGVDLFQYLTRFGPMAPTTTASVIAQLCVALEALHDVSVVHMDVKPGNIVLCSLPGQLHATLIDFGVACDSADVGRTGLAGTPAYMSPERLLDLPRESVHADLWSLAVVAYQCLTGRVPFDDSALGTLCLAIDEGSFVRPRAIRGELSRKLDAWCVKALARRPADRFASALEMREALIEASGPFELVHRVRRVSGDWPTVCTGGRYTKFQEALACPFT
jgi:eukaryotic-like serine/threonine-protein kinase